MAAPDRARDDLLRVPAVPSLARRVAALLERVLYAHGDARSCGDGRVSARAVLDSRLRVLARRHTCVLDALHAQRMRV